MDKEYIKIKDWYDANFAHYAKQSAYLLPRKLNAFISFLPPKGQILDIGSGLGQDTEYFAKKNFTATGIDFSEKMIAYAKKNCRPGKFKTMDMLTLDKHFPRGSFDGVWASASLVHLKDKDIIRVLNKIHRVLKVNGVLGIIVKKKIRENVGAQDVIFRHFSRQDILYFMKTCKFRILHISGCRFKVLLIRDFKLNDGEWYFVVAKKL